MIKSLIDVDDVLKNLATESVRQGEKLRATVRDITLKALQARELSLPQMKRVLRSVTAGVNVGAAGAKVDVDKVLTEARAVWMRRCSRRSKRARLLCNSLA